MLVLFQNEIAFFERDGWKALSENIKFDQLVKTRLDYSLYGAFTVQNICNMMHKELFM